MNKFKFYLIETLTNTCVGSGDETFGIVDVLIQKDPVISLPIIQSSSLKGALKEFAEQNSISQDTIDKFFGVENPGGGEDKPGQAIFFEAKLLTLPLRANRKVYYNATSKFTILEYIEGREALTGVKDNGLEDFKNSIKSLDFNGSEFLVFEKEEGLEVEDYSKSGIFNGNKLKEAFKNYLNLDTSNLAIFTDNIFKEICEESLPVIARNKIGVDGTSKNLFYEQVLPRRSRLWFVIGFDDTIQNEINNLNTKITSSLVQFGGNASIGYGVTKISCLEV